MLTRKGHAESLRRIMETIDNPEAVADDIAALQTDFAQREEILSKYGSLSDDEDATEFEFVETPAPVSDWELKYNDLKAKYVNRFFGGDEGEPAPEAELNESHIEQTETDIETAEDSAPTIDDLFKKD